MMSGDCRARASRRASRPRCRARARRGIAASRPDDRDLRERVGDVAELHVLGKNELIELRHHGVLDVAWQREQHHVAELVDVQVRDHAALRRQIGRVAALPGFQRDDVVGQQALQIRGAIGAGHDDPPAIGAIDQPRTLARGDVGVEGSGWNHDAMLFVVIRSIHSIRGMATVATLALLAAQTSIDASDQQPLVAPALQEAGAFTFTTFLRGAPIGTEQVALTRIADGWTIAGTGRSGAPLDIVGRRVQVRYTSDWRPVELTFDATVRGQAQTIRTTVQGTTATSTISTGGQTTEKTDTIDAAAVLILPGGFFSPYEALAARLRSAAPGIDIPIYSVPGVSFTGRIGESTQEQIQTTARLIAARRTRVTLALPGAPVEIDDLVRRNRSDDSAERARAVARSRARRHRRSLFADRDHLAAERRTGQHPEQRLLARGNDFQARVGGRQAAGRRARRHRRSH